MKTKIKILILVPVLILATVIIYGLSLISAVRNDVKKNQDYVKKEIARIKETGEPVTVSDLGKINIPKSQNAAYIYLKAFKYLPKIKSKSSDKNDWSYINSLDKSLNSNPKVIENAREQVKAAEKSLWLMEKAVLLPICRFPRDYSNPVKTKYTEYKFIRELARLASAKAALQILDYNSDTAIKYSLLSLKTNQACISEPSIIGQLVRYAIIAIGCKSIYRNCLGSSLKNNQLQNIYNELSKINTDKSIRFALINERAMGLWCFDNPGEVLNIDGVEIPVSKQSLIKDNTFFLKRMREVIDVCDIPYYKRVSMGIDKKLEEIPNSPQYMISVMVLPVFVGFAKQKDKAKTTITATKIMLLLKMYHNNYTEYPDSLSQLANNLGKTIDNDPFSGKSFKYKKDGNGFILYSIGENLKDDGGVSSLDLKAKDQSSDNVDMVWKL